MTKQLLFCAFVGTLTACQHEADIQPTSTALAAELVGTYHTNSYLDPSYVALSAGQMPYAELKAESDSTVTLVYTKLYPEKASLSLPHVALSRQTNGVQLRLADSSIGTVQTDRVFTNNGMEKQGKLLRLTIQNDPQNILNFSGSK
ncbi:hypothetical protein [Spirosoma jeollabukense]